jgi:putative methyltransferase (TIGR04325 family)
MFSYRDIAPPFLADWVKQLQRALRRGQPEWEYIPAGWEAERSDPKIKGWNVESVLEAYKSRWDAFVGELKSTDPLGRSPESFASGPFDLVFHNTIMVFAYALALAARHKTSISMLDWGGGIGHYYLISQALVSDLELDYHCKDVPILVAYGRQLLPQAHFYSDEACLSRRYDFILASTSLHYSQDWSRVLEGLARATTGYLLVTQLPVVHQAPSYVFIQRPYRYRYNTEYLGWCLNRIEFLQRAEQSGLKLVREFVTGQQPQIARAPEPCQYRAFLFRRD